MADDAVEMELVPRAGGRVAKFRDAARAEGYGQDSVDSYVAKFSSDARAAGHDDEAIREFLGLDLKPKPAVPQAFVDRLMQGNAAGRVLGAGAAGMKAGFGNEPLGMSDKTFRWFQDQGIFSDPEKGNAGPLRFLNEAVLNPAAVGVDFLGRAINAAAFGVGGAAGQTAKETGANPAEAERLTRDIAALPQALAPLMVPGAKITRPHLTAEGRVVDQPIGVLPTAADFPAAAEAVTGPRTQGVSRGKVEKLWSEQGIHPAEVAEDARTDVTIAQDLAADNMERPRAYGGKPPPDRPPALPEPEAAKNAAEAGENPPPAVRAANAEETASETGNNVSRETLAEGGGGEGKPPALPPEGGGAVGEPRPGGDAGGRALSLDEAREAVLSRLSIGERDVKTPTDLFERAYTDWVDDLNPFRQAIRQALGGGDSARAMRAGKRAERALPTAENAYELLRLLRGAMGQADVFLKYQTFDFNTFKQNGAGLREILNPVRDSLDDFRAYAAARRAIELQNKAVKHEADLAGARNAVDEAKLERAKFDDLGERGLSSEEYRRAQNARGAWTAELTKREALVERLEKRDLKTNPAGIDPVAARTLVRLDNRAGEFNDVLRELVGYQNRLTRFLRDAGVVSQDGYRAMVEANKSYVPFFRLMDPQLGGVRGSRSLAANNPIHAIEGSERMIVDPLESIVKNTYAYVELAMKNAAGQKLVDTLSGRRPIRVMPGDIEISSVREASDGGADLTVTTRPTPRAAIEGRRALAELEPGERVAPSKELIAFAAEHGLAPEAAGELAGVFRFNPPDDGFTIRVLRDGKPEEWKVDAEVARAWRGLDRQSIDLVTQILAVPARSLRAGVTLTPEFMVKNMARDLMGAFINSRGLFSPLDSLRGLMSAIGQDAHYVNWLKGGGANSALVSLDRTYLMENLSQLYEATRFTDGVWNVVDFGLRDLGRVAADKGRQLLTSEESSRLGPLQAARVLSELTENATRLGEFRKVVGQDRAPSKATIQEGAYASRELTIDFARMGAKMRAWNMISSFTNANVQGTDRMVREMQTRPLNFITKAAVGATAPSVLLWWATKDDQRMEEVPRWQRDMFYVVPTDEHIFRVPKDFQTGMLFGSLVERVLDRYYKDNPEAFKKFDDSMIQAFTPGIPVTGVHPIIEQMSGRSLFTGGNLVPQRLEKVLPEYQYSPYTTQTARAIGRVMGAFPGMEGAAASADTGVMNGVARALTNPVLIENYVRAWTGGMGMYVLGLTDRALRDAGVAPDPNLPEKTWADIPFARSFMVRYPAANATSIQDFYDRYHENAMVWNTLRLKAKEGDQAAVDRLQALGPSRLTKMDGVNKTLSEMQASVRNITIDPTTTPQDKRQLIDTFYMRMIEVARDANRQMREIEKLDKPAEKK